MRNSHLYQYLKGLRKAEGSQTDTITAVNVKNKKGQKGLLTALSFMVSVSIFLPLGEQITHASSKTSESTYVIKKGDTLFSLSKKYKMTVTELKQMNHLSSDTIQVGKTLVVSQKSKPVPNKIVPTKNSKSMYNSKVPLKKDYQDYLYTLTKKRGLDYKKTLALIKTESTFKPNAHGGSNYGLMQINSVNHASLAKTLKTANKPYDPYINMNWGTSMLSDLYKYWKGRGYKGAKLDQYVWSSYNRGLGGAKKYGIKSSYVNKMNKNVKYINNLY